MGFPPSFAPRRPGADDARQGGDRPSSTDLELLAQHHTGLILQSCSSLTTCDVASHDDLHAPRDGRRSTRSRVIHLVQGGRRPEALESAASRRKRQRLGHVGPPSVLPGAESTSVCEAVAAAAFCDKRIGGSPKRRSVLADRGADRFSMQRCGRPRPATRHRPHRLDRGRRRGPDATRYSRLRWGRSAAENPPHSQRLVPTAASLKPGAVQSGRSARRAVEPLGEFDDQALGSADVAEEKHVLEVDDLPDRFPAGLSDAVDHATHVVDAEGDVPEPRAIRAPAPAPERRPKARESAPPRTCRCRRGREPSRSRPSRSRDQ